MPTPLTDADKVLRNDTGKDIATNLASIASALTPSNITDLGDVNLTNPITDGQVIKYDTATQKWVNGGLCYDVGDTLNLAGSAYCGRLTGSSKVITFFIPIEKPINSNVTSASINGDFTVYGSQGNDSITNSSSVGSWDITLKPNGILGVFSLENAISSTNGTAIVIFFTASSGSSKYIEFS